MIRFSLRCLCLTIGLLPILIGTRTGAEVVTHVPFRVDHNLLLIDIEVDGRTLPAALDTGMVAGVFFNDPVVAKETGIKSKKKLRVGGAGSGPKPKMTLGAARSIRVGSINFGPSQALVMPEDSDYTRAARGLPFEVVIGYSLFDNYVVEVNHGRGVITLHEPDTYAYEGVGTEWPLTIKQTKPYARVRVTVENGRSVDVKMMLDTGSSGGAVLHTRSHRDLRIPAKAFSVITGRGVRGVETGEIGRIARIDIAGNRLNDALVEFPDSRSRRLSGDRHGVLGSRFLNRFDIVWDYSRKRMILEPNDNFDRPAEFSMLGVQFKLTWNGERVLTIDRVVKRSPAAEAGIRKGDVLLDVNGEPAAGYGYSDLLEMFRNNEGQEYALRLRRGDSDFTVNVRLRRLI